MKLDVLKTIIAVALGAIVSYSLTLIQGFYGYWLYPAAWFVVFSVILAVAIGLNLDWMRTMANIRITSWLTFAGMFVMNLFFAIFCVSTPVFMIFNGLLLLIYLLMVYSLAKAGKEK